jgi:ABC-type dipeptide/oligopeptide/nickel transport system permease component
VIVGVVDVSVVVITLVNFAGELVQALIDPRVKPRSKPAPA